ncbi:hypothetical protein [Marinicella meishanensis]|uniref:hypothetical protein n=1 Tax=Marinicella meishanensis TaxID=2873263 RepID=UPI001CBDD349|nr:hypothetical protein [Marinicella sp. NBU2979]
MKTRTLLLLLISGPSLAADTAVKAPNPFAGLLPLVGHCWQATFPDGKKIDTHCFTSVYDGAFINDQHVVCGEGEPYAGETWYAHDADNNTVNYRYYNSIGGVSDGTVVTNGEQLLFPDETYENKGQSITYRTTWDLSEGQYVSNMWRQDATVEGGWVPVWQMVFKQVALADQSTAVYNEQRQLICQ